MAINLSFLWLAMNLLTLSLANPLQDNSLGQLMEVKIYRDCQEAIENCGPTVNSGVYKVQPSGSPGPFDVYCEVDSNGEVWTWLQHRQDGSLSFDLTWVGYKSGFGDLTGEFWLGNEKIYQITSQEADYTIRFEMTDWADAYASADYLYFYLEDESDNYRLRLGKFTGGDAGDSMSYHRDQQFGTIDKDNDKNAENCASLVGGDGGWWYNNCDNANLNGKYFAGGSTGGTDHGVEWTAWKTATYSLKTSTMKIKRRSHFPI